MADIASVLRYYLFRNDDMFERINAESGKMGGAPCIRDLRIPVSTIVGMIADGMSVAEILDAYPDLQREDILQALRYAAYLTKDREVELAHPK